MHPAWLQIWRPSSSWPIGVTHALITPTTQTNSSSSFQGGMSRPSRESRTWGWRRQNDHAFGSKPTNPQALPIASGVPPYTLQVLAVRCSLLSRGHLNHDDKQLFDGTYPITFQQANRGTSRHAIMPSKGHIVQEPHTGQPQVWHFLNKCSQKVESLKQQWLEGLVDNSHQVKE